MRVLYATDGSGPAREGEHTITSLFDPTLVHIETFAVTPALRLAPLVEADYELERMDVPVLNAERTAGEAADHLEKSGFSVSAASGRGDPANEILRKLADGRHDLVVLGASHISWLGNLLLGSVSMNVLHHAPCSVLVTHRAPLDGNVLIGVDGSEGSRIGLDIAMRVLDRAKCTFSVATVMSKPWVSVAVYPPGPPFGGYPEYRVLEKERNEQAWRIVDRVSSTLKENGFAADTAVLPGRAGPQLLKEADNLGADLVVVGSRGLGPVRRALVGSVSDQVARHAPATLIARAVRADDVTVAA